MTREYEEKILKDLEEKNRELCKLISLNEKLKKEKSL